MALRRPIPALFTAFALLAGCTGKAPAPAAVPVPPPKAPTRPPAVPAPGTPKEPVAALVSKGRRAFESRDIVASRRWFEQAVAAEPNNREALWHLALIAQGQAEGLNRPVSSPYFLRSAAILRRLRAVYPEPTASERAVLPGILYKEATTLALDGESARAVASLAEAVNVGFLDMPRIESDPELDSLRGLPEFRQLTRQLESWLARFMITNWKTFPFTFTLNDLGGKPLKLADLRGKVVVVAFWGTWCPQARKQIPHLAALHRDHRKQGLEVVGLSYEAGPVDDARAAVGAFAKQAGITFPCLIGDDATRDKVTGFAGYPTTLFIDRAGAVRLGLSGYQPLSALDAAASVLLDEGQANARKGDARKDARPVTPARKADP